MGIPVLIITGYDEPHLTKSVGQQYRRFFRETD